MLTSVATIALRAGPLKTWLRHNAACATDVMSQGEFMQCDKVKEYKAWFSSGFELHEIGEKFKAYGLITEFDADYENVYEWFVGYLEDQEIELNVSRKHCDFKGFEKEPIHIMLMYSVTEPENTKIDNIAQSISEVLEVEVNVGFIDYIEGDNFEYRSISAFSS